MRVRFPLPAPSADIAQLVERTLGKGEVGGSNPPISTTLKFVFPFILSSNEIYWLMWFNLPIDNRVYLEGIFKCLKKNLNVQNRT